MRLLLLLHTLALTAEPAEPPAEPPPVVTPAAPDDEDPAQADRAQPEAAEPAPFPADQGNPPPAGLTPQQQDEHARMQWAAVMGGMNQNKPAPAQTAPPSGGEEVAPALASTAGVAAITAAAAGFAAGHLLAGVLLLGGGGVAGAVNSVGVSLQQGRPDALLSEPSAWWLLALWGVPLVVVVALPLAVMADHAFWVPATMAGGPRDRVRWLLAALAPAAGAGPYLLSFVVGGLAVAVTGASLVAVGAVLAMGRGQGSDGVKTAAFSALLAVAVLAPAILAAWNLSGVWAMVLTRSGAYSAVKRWRVRVQEQP